MSAETEAQRIEREVIDALPRRLVYLIPIMLVLGALTLAGCLRAGDHNVRPMFENMERWSK